VSWKASGASKTLRTFSSEPLAYSGLAPGAVGMAATQEKSWPWI
jgi:hypothetical protein